MALLTVTRHGTPGSAPALLIAHGLFGSGRNWGALAKRLSDRGEVLAVDMRNHAGSFWAETHDYPAMATDLAALIEAEGGPMDVLGHSMGGKAAMLLALTRPDLVRRLVVADIAPVAYGHSQSHLIDAMQGLDLAGLESRAEADRRLAQGIEDAQVRAFLLQSLDLQAQPPRWRFNLEVLRRDMAGITGWVDDSALGPFAKPVLFLAGGLSDYVRPDAEARIRRLFPDAQITRIPGAGHWLHAETPREFEASVRAFLA